VAAAQVIPYQALAAAAAALVGLLQTVVLTFHYLVQAH
jgi:hypothetical protein